jgi:transglutaminase-like putative cysteine protease
MTLLVAAGLFFSYGLSFGRDANVALLVILCGLKLLEMNSQREALLVCFLSYFLIITNFLYSQSIPTALYMGIVMVVATATLISLSDEKNSLSTRQRLRLSSTLLMQALPVMLVLFFLFPRVAGPFWKLPLDSHSGITGLSDSMSIGDVSQLSLSDEVAFRVKFDADIPPPEQRYWRGPVLWWTNGRDWKSGFQQYQLIDQLNIHPTDQAFDYAVTLEPHNERWLFALELPIQAPTEASMTPDYRILAEQPVRERMRYQLRSYTHYRADLITNVQERLALQLPRGKHPGARALAAQWRQESPEAIVERALRYFNEEPFVYTYTPELLLDDPIDEFLFETRQGFCEHYAAAFTVLMRAAGIPARVVTGYLGGNVNPIGNYLIVRQRDAHAWSEVWLPNKGWVRIDPTNAVAPTRVEQGIESALPTAFNPLDLSRDSPLVKIWQQLGNGWDALNNGWNQWILGYGPARQRELLSRLGMPGIDWGGMAVALVIIIACLLLGYAVWMFLVPQLAVRDPAQQIYLRFCKKLARQGLHRHPSEGPLDFASRVSAARPDLAAPIQNIIELYVQTRYRSQFQTVAQLRKAVLHFRP